MSEVQRYNAADIRHWLNGEGLFVLASDYEELEAENRRLESQIAMMDSLPMNEGAEKLRAENRELRELAEEVVGEYGMNGSIERLEEFLNQKEESNELVIDEATKKLIRDGGWEEDTHE